MKSMISEVVAGIRIPDSQLAREATDLLREHGTPLVLAHSLRVFLFGGIRGRHRGLKVDHELLYFGAVFHDLGLTARYRSRDAMKRDRVKFSPEPSGTRGGGPQRATEFGCSVRGGPVARTAEHEEVAWRSSVPPGPIPRRAPRVAGDSGGWHSDHVRLREQGRPRPVRRPILRAAHVARERSLRVGA